MCEFQCRLFFIIDRLRTYDLPIMRNHNTFIGTAYVHCW